MEGTVAWPQAIWIFSAMGGAAALGFLAAWRFWIVRSRDIEKCEEKVKSLSELLGSKIQGLEHSLESRVTAIEIFNAGTVVTLEHIKNFREEVQTMHERLRSERKTDIEGINLRLDAIFNTVQMVKLRDKPSA